MADFNPLAYHGINLLFPFIMIYDNTVSEGSEILGYFYSRLTKSYIVPLNKPEIQSYCIAKDYLPEYYNDDPTLIGILQKLLDLRGAIYSFRGIAESTFNESCKCVNIILPFQYFPASANINVSSYSIKLSISILEYNNVTVASIFTDLSILNSNAFNLIPFTREISPIITKSATIKTRNENIEEINPLPNMLLFTASVSDIFTSVSTLNTSVVYFNSLLFKWLNTSTYEFNNKTIRIMRTQEESNIINFISAKLVPHNVENFVNYYFPHALSSYLIPESILAVEGFSIKKTAQEFKSFPLLSRLSIEPKPIEYVNYQASWSHKIIPVPIDLQNIIFDHISKLMKSECILSCPVFPDVYPKFFAGNHFFDKIYSQFTSQDKLKNEIHSHSNDDFTFADLPSIASLFKIVGVSLLLRGQVVSQIGKLNTSLQVGQYNGLFSGIEGDALKVKWIHSPSTIVSIEGNKGMFMSSLLSLSNYLFGYVCMGSVVLVLSMIPNEDARSAIRNVLGSNQISTRTSFALFASLRTSVSFTSLCHDIIHLTTSFWSLFSSSHLLSASSSSSGGFVADCLQQCASETVMTRMAFCDSSPILTNILFAECLNSDMELKRQAVKDKVLTYLAKYSRQNMNSVDTVDILHTLTMFSKEINSESSVNLNKYVKNIRKNSLILISDNDKKNKFLKPVSSRIGAIVSALMDAKDTESARFIELVSLLLSKKFLDPLDDSDYDFIKASPFTLSLPINRVISTPLSSIFDYLFVQNDNFVYSPSMQAWANCNPNVPLLASSWKLGQDSKSIKLPYYNSAFSFSISVRFHFIAFVSRLRKLLLKMSKFNNGSAFGNISFDMHRLSQNIIHPITISGIIKTNPKVEMYVCHQAGVPVDIVNYAFNAFYSPI